MNDTHKLLLAFIEASGYEVERTPITTNFVKKGSEGGWFASPEPDVTYVNTVIDYKVTKKQVVKRGSRGSSKRAVEQVELELLKRDLSTHIQLVINGMDIDCGRHGSERVVDAITDTVMFGVMRGKP